MNTRLLALGAIPALLLAGCSVGSPAPSPAATSTMAPEPAPTETVAPVDDDAFYSDVDELKALFDQWHYTWLSGGCDDTVNADDRPECLALLTYGIGLARGGDELLAGRDLEDDLVPVQTGVSYATWRGDQWLAAGCETTTSAECTELTVGVVDDLEYTQEFLQLWSR